MSGSEKDKAPKYLFGAFCFYLLYFACVIIYLAVDMGWIFVPGASFLAGLFILKRYGGRIEVQAYTVSVLTYINIVAYSVIFAEFTEVFTVFCSAVCLISFYHVLKVNYLMFGLSTVYIVYELVWREAWHSIVSRDASVAVAIRIVSFYLVQILLILLIKRQQELQRLAERRVQAAEDGLQAREDFLANMSHEIRTPMNAITGMVELVLRSEAVPPQEKEYLYNIRTAGEELVSIIDDVLDITKMDSGSLEIVAEEYEITAIVHDVVNITQMMLGDKQVVLLVEVSPDIPMKLWGDGARVKQIIRNLLDNAAKYTKKGTIRLQVEVLPVDGGNSQVDLKVTVTDTGIGMSRMQLNDLFGKFKQGEGSGSRTQGGSGLGLAVSGRLAELMQGSLVARSEPGRGSEFVLTVRQDVIDAAPYSTVEPQPEEQSPLQMKENTKQQEKRGKEGRQTTFTAPGVRILLVDDNKVNLKVAEGLLRPYKMCIETACSGMQAVEMAQNRIYDLIFMDHMMPQMDGVEAMKIIRGLEGEHHRLMPIIALSANAVRGAREMFLEAGMSDFVAKPIEMRIMDETLRRWLPEDKILLNKDVSAAYPEEDESGEDADRKTNPLRWQMEGIDVVVGMKYAGEDVDLYRDVLTDYMDTIEEKAEIIESAVAAGDIETYTIEVHSLKSTSKSIGATSLSEFAKDLEMNGKNEEWGPIIARTPALLSMYRGLYHSIMPYRAVREEEAQDREPIDDGKLNELLGQLLNSIEMYDSIQAEEIIEELTGYAIDDKWSGYMQDVNDAMGHFDYDACKEKVVLWRGSLMEN